jgi:hypothetical protein
MMVCVMNRRNVVIHLLCLFNLCIIFYVNFGAVGMVMDMTPVVVCFECGASLILI